MKCFRKSSSEGLFGRLLVTWQWVWYIFDRHRWSLGLRCSEIRTHTGTTSNSRKTSNLFTVRAKYYWVIQPFFLRDSAMDFQRKGLLKSKDYVALIAPTQANFKQRALTQPHEAKNWFDSRSNLLEIQLFPDKFWQILTKSKLRFS